MATIQERNFTRLLHLTAHAWRQAIDRRMKEDGLSTSSWMAVAILAEEPEPLTQKALAQALGLENASVVPLVDRLVRQNLVTRVQPAEDRRKRLLFVTETGINVYQKLRIETDALRYELLANIDSEELKIAERVLNQLLADIGEK